MEWQRARQPDQIEARRIAILEAAKTHFDLAPNKVSLRAIGREVGLSTSNLYRYFSSREAILLAVLTDELEGWMDAMAESCDHLPVSPSVDAIVGALVTATIDRERLIRLMGQRSLLIERTASADEVHAFRTRVVELGERSSHGLAKHLPALSLRQVGDFQAYFYHLVSATWHLRFPSEAAVEAMSRSSLSHVTHDYQTVLRRGLTIMARGLLAEASDEVE